MAQGRKHRVMSAAEQKARGASAYSRSEGPRNLTQQEVNDPNRYIEMNQARQQRFSFSDGSSKSYSKVGNKKFRAPEFGDSKLPNLPNIPKLPFSPNLGGFSLRRALHWLKNGVLALLAAYVIFVCFVSVKMNLGVDLATRSKLSFAIPGQPYYTLLVGSDKSEERVESGMTTYRTDSIILARVDPVGGKITLVSIQRDTKVDLGEYGTQKINAAYTFGGAPLLIQAVSDLAGVPISNYAEIDFDSFVSVVDALGGIDVNVPIDIDDDLAEVHLSAGEQTINGAEALGLCRARHAYDSYGAGDYYRTANQRMVLGAILKKGLNGNPFNLVSLIGAVSNSVSCTFLPLNITFLGLRFIGFDMSENLMSGLEPTYSSYENGTWYEVVDSEAWAIMMSRVEQGLSPYADSTEDPTAGVAGIA